MKASLEQVTWEQVRDKVIRVNPTIAELIDAIKPNHAHNKLFIARYPFGSKLVEAGTLLLPSENGKLVPIHDASIPSKVRDLIDYTTIPLCLWLNTTGEVFVEFDNRRIPLNVFHPGSICGLWETLDPPNSAFSKRMWSISAGAHSLFTLPKINDASSFKKLEKKYGLHTSSLPKTIFEQIQLYAKIANNPTVNSNWMSEILIFTKDWVQKDLSDKQWIALHYTLLKNAWTESLYWRNKVTLDLIGQMLAQAQSQRNLKPSNYLIDTVMHLISIAIGANLGFEPIVNDETCAPINLIQTALTKDYGLKTYIPTMMKSNYLSMTELNKPLYYSLQIPAMLGNTPNFKKPHSVLDDLRMVKRLLESLRTTLEKNNLAMFDLIKNVQFDFFHTDADTHSNIKSTDMMPLQDDRLTHYHESDRKFCETNSFFRGCISITRTA